MRRRTFLLSSSALVLAAVLPCGAALAAQDAATIVLSSEETGAPHNDPIRATLLNMTADLIYDRLVALSDERKYYPHLATSWEEAPDGLSWTFHLRQDVRFHDGEPFNAQTIAWWIPKFAGSPNEQVANAIERVVVIDDHTVRFEMKRPDPNLLYNLASTFMGVPSPKAYDAEGENYGIAVAIGTGAYKLESFTVGQETVLVANEDYAWGTELSVNRAAPTIKRLVFREISDASTAFLEMNTGGVDMLLDVPTEFVPQLKANSQFQVRNFAPTGISYLEFNTSTPLFSDPLVRQAVALAIDQEPIVKAVFNGIGSPAHQFLISSLEESKVDPKLLIRQDLSKARQLLDQAGWKAGADGIRVKDGVPLRVKLGASSETAYKRMAEIIQSQLKNVGMAADVNLYDMASLRDARTRGEHQLAVAHYDWDNADILSWFFAARNIPTPNASRWKDPKSEQLLSDAETHARNWQERIAKFRAYHENLLGNFVFVPLHEFEKTISVNQSRLVLPEKIRESAIGNATFLDAKLV